MQFPYFKTQTICCICCLKLFSSSFVQIVKTHQFQIEILIHHYQILPKCPNVQSSIFIPTFLFLASDLYSEADFDPTDFSLSLFLFFLSRSVPSFQEDKDDHSTWSTSFFMFFSICIEWITNPGFQSFNISYFSEPLCFPPNTSKLPFPHEMLSLAHCYLKTNKSVRKCFRKGFTW